VDGLDLRVRLGSLLSWTSLLGRPHYTLGVTAPYQLRLAEYHSDIDGQLLEVRHKAELEYERHFQTAPHGLKYFDNQLARMNVIVGLLRDLPVGSAGADIGIAFGYMDIVLRDTYGHRIFGVDSPEGKAAFGSFPMAQGIDIQEWNIGHHPPPLTVNSLDYVIFAEILEHLKTPPLPVLREIAGVLRHNGRLVLTTPNFGRFDNIWRLTRGMNIVDEYPDELPLGADATDHVEHVREYTISEVVTLVHRTGLSVESVVMCNSRRNRCAPRSYLEETMCVFARKI
jgi:SAM-dependent methyltransferase